MLRLIRTSSPLALLVLAGLAIAGTLLAWKLRSDPEPRAGLSATEQIRATAHLAAHASVQNGHADVDRDGRVDCWSQARGDENRYLTPKLLVWRGCTGDPITFEWWTAGMSVLAIPPELASPLWLRWIAGRIAGDHTSCVGIVGCPAPGQAWQWVLDSARRYPAQPGHHGTVTPRWSTGPRTSGGALVLPSVPAGWMQRLRGSEEPEPETSRPGARIVIDLGGADWLPPISCGGLTVHAEAGGIVGTDAQGRWTWLFRGLAGYGAFHAKRLVCLDGVAIATTLGSFADIAAIEPATGGWLFDRSSDCCPGAEVAPTLGGDHLYSRDFGTVVTVRKLHAWLARPAAERPSLVEVSHAARPELAHEGAFTATVIGRNHPDGELWGEPFDATTIDAAMRAALPMTLECA
ncbi:MAG TPA: hypothetical protein VIU61_05425, partial [Kofleriaceae bacterium]